MHEDTHHTLINKRIESNDDDHLDMEDQDDHFQEDMGYFQSQSMKLKRVTFKAKEESGRVILYHLLYFSLLMMFLVQSLSNLCWMVSSTS